MITLEMVWTEAAQTRLYRALLAAFSHPGDLVEMGSALDGRRASLGVLATLADAATTVADPDQLLEERDRSLIGAGVADLAHAAFVLAAGATAAPENYALMRGDRLNPERGAMLVLDCARIGAGSQRLVCSGPGIAETARLTVDGLHPTWLALRERHCLRQPLGIDVILADDRRIVAWPRTTRIIVEGF